MPSGPTKSAKPNRPSSEKFEINVKAILHLLADGRFTGEQGIQMLEDIIYHSIKDAPDEWIDPRPSVHMHPLVFESLNRVRFRMLKDVEDQEERDARFAPVIS